MPTCKIMFDMRGQTPEFKKGFMAALDWFDGVAQGQEAIQLEFSSKDFAMISLDDGGANDNRTYHVRNGHMVFESLGVEV